MIKRGTVAHDILLEVMDNPTDIRDLANQIGSDTNSVRVSVRSMIKRGINLQRKGDIVYIKCKDMPEVSMYAQEKVYIHIFEHGSIDSSEVRELCGVDYNAQAIHEIMDRVERDFSVKLESKLEKKVGKRSTRTWRLV
jgi:predicted DNA-binding transcriptional regulator